MEDTSSGAISMNPQTSIGGNEMSENADAESHTEAIDVSKLEYFVILSHDEDVFSWESKVVISRFEDAPKSILHTSSTQNQSSERRININLEENKIRHFESIEPWDLYFWDESEEDVMTPEEEILGEIFGYGRRYESNESSCSDVSQSEECTPSTVGTSSEDNYDWQMMSNDLEKERNEIFDLAQQLLKLTE